MITPNPGRHLTTGDLERTERWRSGNGRERRQVRTATVDFVFMKLPTPTDSDVRNVLDRQVLVMFELANEVLSDLTLEECLWRVSERSWTVHERNGQWIGEVGEEPPGLPTPSLAWTLWHPMWWLSVLLAHSYDAEIPTAESIPWPGPETSLDVIRDRWSEWMTFTKSLDDAALQASELTKFPYSDGRPFVYILGWASMELTKNLSELCLQRRLVREVSAP